jgi:hypothetical protein
MSRFVCSVMVVVAGVAGIAAPVSAAPGEDFVVGSGEIAVPFPGFPPVVLGVSVDAHSDASGASPSGNFTIFFAPDGAVLFGGPVTCLLITGNIAIIGFEDAREGHLIFEVVDNSATGSPDTIGLVPGASGCSPGSSPSALPLVSGDFVVHDAVPLTSKDQCKAAGWRDFTDDQGHPFKNQGECIAFVEHAT